MIAAAAILVMYAPRLIQAPSRQLVFALVLALAIGFAETHHIPLGDDKDVTVSAGISFAVVVLMGSGLAIWTTAIGMAIAYGYLDLYQKRWKWYNGTFNVANYVMSATFAALIYHQLGPMEPDIVSWAGVVSLSAAAIVYFLVNTGLVAVVVTLRRSLAIWSVWADYGRKIGTEYFALMLLGTVIAATYNHVPLMLPLLAIPLIVLYYSLKEQQTVSEAG